MSIPDWWEAVLLAGAGYRTWRLLAHDTLTERAREWLLFEGGRDYPDVEDWLLCPWCAGFWITTGWWAVWLVWPGVLALAVPLLLSSLVGWAWKQLG